MNRRITTFAAVLLAGLPAARAATFNWLGNSGNWSDPSQWIELAAPPSAATTDLAFGGAGGYAATDDFAGTFLLNSITLNTANSTFLAGNEMSFVSDGAETPSFTQSGAGAFAIGNAIDATNVLTFTGAGTGLVTLNGVLSGAGGMNFTGANWRLTNTANTFTGPMNIGTGAFVEIAPAGALSFAVGAATLLGNNAAVTINGGTLKLTTAAGATIALGGARPVVFGAAGGTLDITNSLTGNIASGDLALTLNNSAGSVAILKFNGGVNGLSSNNVTDGNWNTGGNTLRFSGITGAGALRLELTNGATVRNSTASVTQQVTMRGVVGGDPTSGALGTVNTGLSRTLGRLAVDSVNESTHSLLTFQGAVQVGVVGNTRALNGTIVVAGTLSGNAGYVDFTGRGTGTQLSSTLNAPGTAGAGQNPLWLLRNGNGSLTIQDGSIAAFDVRQRTDTGGRNGNGVALDGPATIEGGGQLRIIQSVSNFTTGVAATDANVGDVIIFGDITGSGSTAKESIFSIALPEPQTGGTNANTIPVTLGAATTQVPNGVRPYGGLRFDDSRGLADFIVNGSGFGGLRIEGIARPNELLSADGTTAGAPIPDPVTTLTKVNSVLTDARLARLGGSGGYLTIAPTGFTYAMNPGAVWGNANVGLRVADHNSGGVDVSLGALGSWANNLAIDAGATLDLGAQNPFFFSGPGVLHGKGSITGTGSVFVDTAGSISPGLGDIGTLTLGLPLALSGGLSIGVNNATADLLAVTGGLTLGGALALSGTFGTSDLTIASYTGALSGTFSGVTGLDPDFTVDYGTGNNSIVSLKYTAVVTRIWNGNVSGTWNTATANWQGGATFTNGQKVLFDDSAAGPNFTVSVTGGDVTPALVTVNNSGTAYTLISSAGNAITGSTKLVKNNNGILTLSGPASYTGGTEINAGSVLLATADSLPIGGAVTIASGATLDTQGNGGAFGDVVVNGALIGAGGDVGVQSLTLGSGAIFGTGLELYGDLTKTGAAPSILPGAIDLDNAARTISVDAGTAPELTLNGVISAGALIKTGAGTLVLGNGGNIFSGGVTVNGGTLRAGAAGAIPAGGSVTVGASGVLDLNGIATVLTDLTTSGVVQNANANLSVENLTGTGGTLNLGSGHLDITGAGTTAYSGAITAASVERHAGGRTTLTGNGTQPATLVTGGTLVLGGGGGGTAAGLVTAQPGGRLGIASALASPITLNGGTIFPAAGLGNIAPSLTAAAGTTSFALNYDPDTANIFNVVHTGTLNGSGDIEISITTNLPHPDGGVGWRLHGTQPSGFSGRLTVGQGVKFEIQVGNAGPHSPAGTGTIVMTGGNFTGALNGNYSQFNTRNNFAGNTTVGNNVEIIGAGFANFNLAGGAVAGSRFTLGNLKIGGGQTAGANKNGATGQIVEFTSVTLTGGNATFAPTTVGFGATGGADMRLGPIGESVAGSGIIMDGSSILTLAGANTYTGPTLLNRGTTILEAAASIASSPDVTVALGATLDVNVLGALIVPTTQTLTVNGTLSGAIALEGTLRGSGNIAAGVSTSGALIEPGNSAGILSIGELRLDDTSELSIEFGKLNIGTPIAGSDYDQVSSFDITLGGALLTGTQLNSGLETGDILTIILNNNGLLPVGGEFAGAANASTVTLDGAQFKISYFDDAATGAFETTGGNDVSLQYIIPEPASATLLLGGIGLLLARRRRRKEAAEL